MAKLNRETRQQTVRIEDSAGNGSGVIVAKQGNTYYVLTAKHVLETPADNKNPKQRHTRTKVITHDQERYNIEPSNIKLAEGVDLAIVKFTSQANYPVAKIGNYSPTGGAEVFAAGYPGREKIDSPLWQWQLNPGGIAEKEQGKLNTQDKQSFSNGYDLIYSSITQGGMSGGPVFDIDGRVIGIHGRAEGEQRAGKDLILGQSLGISIQTFLGLTERLQVPKVLKVSSNSPAKLDRTAQATIIAVRDNIAQPQTDSNGEQWVQYGNQLYRIGKSSEAAVAFDKAISKGRDYQLLGNYGKALALAGLDNVRALKAISTAIAAMPATEQRKYYYLWKYQSIIYKNLGKYDDALKSIEIAIKLEDSDLFLLNEKASILGHKKQYREAIEIYDSMIEKQPEAYSYVNRGNIKDELGDKQGAIKDYNRAIAINGQFSKTYFNRGLVKHKLGDKQGAISDYSRAIALNPQDSQSYNNRGLLKSEIGDDSGAINDYTLAININNQSANSYRGRGGLKYKSRDYFAAIKDYDRAIIIDPSYANSYVMRSLSKSELGQKRAAVADLNQAIILDPNLYEAYVTRGNLKSELGDRKAAIDDYTKAITINPKYALTYVMRGSLKGASGDLKAAISDFDLAISINPNLADAYDGRGLAKAQLGQQESAISDFDRVIKIDPNHAWAYNNRGTSKSYLGQKQAAIEDLTTAADLFRQQNRMNLSEQAIGLIQKMRN